MVLLVVDFSSQDKEADIKINNCDKIYENKTRIMEDTSSRGSLAGEGLNRPLRARESATRAVIPE